jgi:hypothetical protein
VKTLIAASMTALLATIAVSFAAPDNKEALIAKEKATWAFKDKKADEFKKLIAADVVAVYADGINDMQKELEVMPKADMKSFELSDFKVVFPSAHIAVVAYKAKVEGTANGVDVSGTYNAGSVWHMVNGQWMGIFHSEMKAAPAAAPGG